jgi:hypothetical protein
VKQWAFPLVSAVLLTVLLTETRAAGAPKSQNVTLVE